MYSLTTCIHLPIVFTPHRQRLIPITCYVLHNFIQKEARRNRLLREFELEDMIIEEEA